MKLSIFKFRLKENDYVRFISIINIDEENNNFNLKNESFYNKLLKIYNKNTVNIRQIISKYTTQTEKTGINHEFILNNLDHIYHRDDDAYFFDLQYALFDNLKKDGILFLDNIFADVLKKEKKEYINKKFWNKYNPYHIHLVENNLNKLQLKNNKQNHKKTDFEFINSLDEIKKITSYIPKIFKNNDNLDDIKNNFVEFNGFTLNPQDEIDCIICFLEMIFWFEFPYIVRKCNDCQKYFITKSGNTSNCCRIGKDGLTCSERADKIRRQHTRDIPIKKLEKKIRDMLRDKLEYNEFIEENNNKKNEFYGKNKEYVLWLLTYINPDKINKVIKDLELEKYLNNE